MATFEITMIEQKKNNRNYFLERFEATDQEEAELLGEKIVRTSRKKITGWKVEKLKNNL